MTNTPFGLARTACQHILKEPISADGHILI